MPEAQDTFFERGWVTLPSDPVLAQWIQATLPAAKATLADPKNKQWYRYQNTWFAGVNVLPNDSAGKVAGGLALQGQALEFIHSHVSQREYQLDAAQISVCYPGYPQPMPSESEAAYRFRRDRDAAHLDGLIPVGNDRRRYLQEHHAFILGIPMVAFSEDASPLVIWEGSHEVIRSRLQQELENLPAENWNTVDLTDVYQQVRKEIFDHCERTTVHALPGEAIVMHRLAIHGVAPWKEGAWCDDIGRMICYFRPLLADPAHWLMDP